MADWSYTTEYYVSSSAGGGGDGSVGTPWTLAEAVAAVNASSISSCRINIKADGTYSTTGVSITAGGGATGYQEFICFQGYTTTIADGGKATIQKSSGTNNLWDCKQSYYMLRDIILDGNSLNGAGYWGKVSDNFCVNCEAYGGQYGFVVGYFFNCYAHDTTAQGFNSGYCYYCISDTTVIGYTACPVVYKCIGKDNSAYNFTGCTSILDCICDNGTNGGIFINRGHVVLNTSIVNTPTSKYGIDFFYTPNHGNNIFFGLNFFSNVNDTDQAGGIPVDGIGSTANPSFTDSANLNYTRAATDLDGKGFSSVGTQSYDYDVDIGIGRKVPVISTASPVFIGISQLEAVGGGCLRAVWAASTSGSITSYNVYVKDTSGTNLFSSPYLAFKLATTTTACIFRMESDSNTFLDSTQTYFVGIRADNDGAEDANVLSLNAVIVGDGSTYVKTPKIGLNI